MHSSAREPGDFSKMVILLIEMKGHDGEAGGGGGRVETL
jgi:hypothetical protein